MKRYIPNKVLKLITESTFDNKDNLIVICDMITRISIYRGKSKDKSGNKIYSNEFTEIPKTYFRNVINNFSDLGIAFKYLKENNIVITDGTYHYLTNYKKCIGYKFNDELISVVCATSISNNSLIKRIKNTNKKMNINNAIKDYRKYFLSNFRLRTKDALEWIKKELELSTHGIKEGSPKWIECINRYNYSCMAVHMVDDGDLFFKRNSTNGRIDTNLTNLRSELRQFIDIDNLVQIDIKNSQPLLLSTLLDPLLCRENKFLEEMESFIDKCFGGNLYDHVFQLFYKKTTKVLTRKEIKNIMFAILYSKPGSYRKEKAIFGEIFPNILEWIEKRKGKNHQKFAINLQKIESSMCIDTILPRLHSKGIMCFTVHDSWIIDNTQLEETISIINECFIEKWNRQPQLSIEKLNKQ